MIPYYFELIISLFFYIGGDVITTMIVLSHPNGYEANPIMRYILNKTGYYGMITSKAIIIILLIVWWPEYLIFMALAGIIITGLNTFTIISRKKKKTDEFISL